MKMKNVIEVEFQNAGEATKAAAIINEAKTDDEISRAKVNATSKGKMLIVTITASDFTALRALTTTAMRDLKVIVDGFKIVKR